ncbi:MAG: DUF5618 family protein [Nitrospirota bacterium]
MISPYQRYLENTEELLSKSPIEGDRHEDIKYVQEACGAAYLAILKALDTYLLKRYFQVCKGVY